MQTQEAVLDELLIARDRLRNGRFIRGDFYRWNYGIDHDGRMFRDNLSMCAVGAVYEGRPSSVKFGMECDLFRRRRAAVRALGRTLVIYNPAHVLLLCFVGLNGLVQMHNDATEKRRVIRNFDRTIRRYMRVVERKERFEPARSMMAGEGGPEINRGNRRGHRVPNFVPAPSLG